MFSKQSYSWGTFLVLIFKKLQDWKKSLEKFQPILLVYTKQTEAQHKCQPKLLRSKHLTACTAKAVLTLTPSSALNHMCTRQPMCPGEALQLNNLLLGTEVPQAVLTKQSPRAGARSPGGSPAARPHHLAFSFILSLTWGLLLTKAAGEDSEHHWGLSRSWSCPSFHAFSRNSSSGLPLQGWAEEFSSSCYCKGGSVASQGLKSQDSAPAAAVVKPSS